MVRRKDIILGGKRHTSIKTGIVIKRIRFWSISVAIIMFVIFSTRSIDNDRRVKQAQIDISRIAHAVRLFRADFGRCPEDVSELSVPPEGTPYITPIMDPWGHSYELMCPSRWDMEDVDVISKGPDVEVSKDNIKNLVVDMNL